MSLHQLIYGAAAPSGAAAAAGRQSPTTTGRLPVPVAALVELGVVDQAAAIRAGAEDISRAHPVWRVRLANGRRLVVKAGIGHGGPDLAVECLVYRMTWWCEPLARALPTAVVVDEDRQLLVLADVGDAAGSGSLAQHVGWSSLLTGIAAPNPTMISKGVARTLGRTVGALHRTTAGYPLPPAPPPLVLSVVGRAEQAQGGHSAQAQSRPAQAQAQAQSAQSAQSAQAQSAQSARAQSAQSAQAQSAQDARTAQLSPAVRATVARLGSHRFIVDAVDELRRPVSGCLVNHDLKWDNVVLDERDATREPAPVLLDWELAGLGDPAWDLGCLLAEHLIRSVPTTLPIDSGASLGASASPSPATASAAPLDDSARALLVGYREGSRPRADVVAVLARRVVLAAGVRIAQLALEVAWTPSSGDTGAIDRLTDRALLVLGAPTLIEEVRQCLA